MINSHLDFKNHSNLDIFINPYFLILFLLTQYVCAWNEMNTLP